MLLFEFFPLFVALVSIVAGGWLFMLNLEAAQQHAQRPSHSDSSSYSNPYLRMRM